MYVCHLNQKSTGFPLPLGAEELWEGVAEWQPGVVWLTFLVWNETSAN